MSEGLTRHWATEDKRKPRRRGFEMQEARAAKAHPGGKGTRGSGCSHHPSRKGDSVGDYFRQECKTTEREGAKSISIKRSWLDKIDAEARATGLRPMFVLGFSADAGHLTRTDWMAVPLPVGEAMTKACAALLNGDIEEAQAYAALALES
jgi:hypothetical protein